MKVPADARRAAKAESRFDRSFDLRELLSVFYRRIWLFLAIFVLATVGAVVATQFMTPVYTASAAVKLDPNATNRPNTSLADRADPAAVLETEISVARSRRVAAGVIENLGLLKDPAFGGSPTATAAPTPEQFEAMVSAVLGGLDVVREGETYVINVSYTTADPVRAATLANAFAAEYIRATASLRQDSARAQAEAFNSGLSRLESEAQSASAAAAGYRAQAGLVTATSGTVLQQQASAIAAQLSTAEATLAVTQAQLNEAMAQRRAGASDAVGGVLNSPVVQNLRAQRTQLLSQRAEIATRYGPRHPEYLKIQEQINGIEVQISQEIERVISSLQAQARATSASVQSMRSRLAGLQGQLAASAGAEAQAQQLEREAAAKQEVYNQYSLAQQGAAQAQRVQDTSAAVLTAAVPPMAPSFPNKPLFGVLGAALGVILGLGAVALAEALDPGMLNARDTESALGVPVLASIPLLPSKVLKQAKGGPERYAIAKPMSVFAESYRAIRSALVHSVSQAPKLICITSALPSEGKSVAALTFARVLGMGGARVAVVDCDLRRSSLARMTRVNVDVGLVEVVTGKARLADSLVADSVPGVALLPLSAASFSPADLLGSKAFTDVLDQLRARFDFVILDTPPVLAVADARAVAAVSDAVVLLCRWSKTPRAAANTALHMLEQEGAPIAGVVLNMVKLSARGALTAADPAFYHKAYQGYYVN